MPILERSEWQAYAVNLTGVPRSQYKKIGKIRYLSVHYTGSRAFLSGTSEAQLLRNSQSGSIKKYGDIPYHYVVGYSGTVYKGRDDKVAPGSGTHYYSLDDLKRAKHGKDGSLLRSSVRKHPKPGNTEGHITVTFAMGFGEPKIAPEAAMNTAAKLIAQLLVKYNLTPEDVRARREIAVSVCPGDEIYYWLRGKGEGKGKGKDGEGIGMKRISAEYMALTQ